MPDSRCLIALVGPSGVGKTFWSNRLIEYFGGKLRRIKNTTTRQPRDERDYESYNFVSREDFEKGIKDGCFLEWDEYLDNYYGSSLEEILTTLKENHGIFAITPKGAEALYCHRSEINLAIILLVPASLEVMKRNFAKRGITDPEKQAELLSAADQFKFPPEIEHCLFIVTGNTAEDQQKLLAIVEPLLTKNSS